MRANRYSTRVVDVAIGHGKHASTPAAVAAVRAAPGNVFLSPKAHCAVAAFSGVDLDVGFVDKFHHENKKALSHG